MKLIKYISDIHLERRFKPVRFKKNTLGGVLFITGDIGSPLQDKYWDFMDYVSDNFNKIFFISGNHEYWNNKGITINEMDNIIEDKVMNYSNVYYLNNKMIKYKNYEIIGTTLWSNPYNNLYNSIDFMNIYYQQNQLLTPKTMRKLYNNDKKWLTEMIKKNNHQKIILTHYCPSFRFSKKYNRYLKLESLFATNMEFLIDYPVKLWIFGHIHSNKKININNVPCLVNAPGYYRKCNLEEYYI